MDKSIDKKLIEGFSKIGIAIPEILLPKKDIDLRKWCVVACDQYTSQKSYWDEVEKIVGKDPSTLRIMLPEIYLEGTDVDNRIKDINKTMKDYLDSGILVQQKPGFIYVDRSTSHAGSRKGLIVALDLECYDYNKGSSTFIRATEGTVVERLPPRIKIRENAPIEMPHIMVLIDDPKMTVIEPFAKKRLTKIYDIDLMMNGGHLKGYKIENDAILKNILDALNKLADQQSYNKKYDIKKDNMLLYAMGDGNHSLATAKAIWESKKKILSPEEQKVHPSRFALVELVNVHDMGLKFEPIHRVLFNIDEKLFERMKRFYAAQGSIFSYTEYDMKNEKKPLGHGLSRERNTHKIGYIQGKHHGALIIKNPKSNLEVGTLQSFLDAYIKESKARIDYIHGDDVVMRLGSEEKNIGFFLPPMEKRELFKTVILDGALPRKTFSMGEAEEKRYYLEARKIIN